MDHDSTGKDSTRIDPSRAAPTVSGRAFLGLFKSIKRRGGDDLLKRVVNGAGPEARAVLARPIPKLSWQPYGAFVSFLEAADRTVGSGDRSFAKVLGAEAGKIGSRDGAESLRRALERRTADPLVFHRLGELLPERGSNGGRELGSG